MGGGDVGCSSSCGDVAVLVVIVEVVVVVVVEMGGDVATVRRRWTCRRRGS